MSWQPPDTDNVPPETIAQIIANLGDSDPDVRLRAIDLVSQWYYDDPAVIEAALPHIIPLMADPDRSVRISAAHTVGEVGGQADAPALLAALDRESADRGVQLVIIKAMGRIDQKDITRRLAYTFHMTDSRCLRVAARKALERIGTPEALAMLVC